MARSSDYREVWDGPLACFPVYVRDECNGGAMNPIEALIVLLVIGVVAWLLPIPHIVVAVAVVIVLLAVVVPYLRRART